MVKSKPCTLYNVCIQMPLGVWAEPSPCNIFVCQSKDFKMMMTHIKLDFPRCHLSPNLRKMYILQVLIYSHNCQPLADDKIRVSYISLYLTQSFIKISSFLFSGGVFLILPVVSCILVACHVPALTDLIYFLSLIFLGKFLILQ